jgi:NADPH:quinone reductase-like Zn-dependent oxidoreductase
VVAVSLKKKLRSDPERARDALADIARLTAQGVFRPLIGARYPLSGALDALRALAARAVPGNIVVEVGGG